MSAQVQQLIEKAEDAVHQLDFYKAAEYYDKAHRLEPQNCKIKDDFAQTLLELGDTEKAVQLLKESIQLEPEGGYEKYMNFGQTLKGKEAVECFSRGINLMTKVYENLKRANANTNEEKLRLSTLPFQISSAYCSIAEIYLTDLCFEDSAESECEKNVENAIQWNKENAEVFVLKANLLLSQNKPHEAVPAIQHSFNLWKNIEDESKWPSYLIQLQTAKIMIELALRDDAIEILELLTEQEDDNSEVWYLLGLCYFGDGETPIDAGPSFECLTKSKDLLLKMGENRPPGALEQVEELLSKATQFYNPADDEGDDDNEDEEMDDQLHH